MPRRRSADGYESLAAGCGAAARCAETRGRVPVRLESRRGTEAQPGAARRSRSRSRRCSRSSSSTRRSPAAERRRSRRASSTGRTGEVSLAGRVVGPITGDAHAGGLRFRLRDIKGTARQTVAVVYTGSVPDLFQAGRDVVVEGKLQNGTFVAQARLARDEVPVEVRARRSRLTRCPSSAAPRSSSRSGSRCTRSSRARPPPARAAAGSPPRRRTRSLAAFGSTRGRRGRAARGASPRDDFSFAYVAGAHRAASCRLGYTLSAFWGGQEGSLLLWLLVLTGYARGSRSARPQAARATSSSGSCPCSAASPSFFAFLLVAVASPFDDAARARRRRRAQPEPPEPVHGRPPAAPLPRLRRADRAVRVRDGRAALGPHRRALDRRDAPLDARRVDVPRDRPAARRALGLRGGRLGRLLRLGSRSRTPR